jgi:hypothetical protein
MKIIAPKRLMESIFPTVRNGSIFNASSLDLQFARTKTLDPRVTFTRASSGTYVGSDGLIKTATANEPRFDHNPTTGESLGLLVEEQRTNLLLRSEEFNNAAWVVGGTIAANTQTAPNGTLTADTLTTTGGAQSIYQQDTVIASTTYTASCYVRLGTLIAAEFKIAIRDDSAGVFIASDVIPSQVPTSTGWTRITYTFTTPVGCTLVRFYPFRNSIGLSTSTLHLWGAQLEAGAFPTSYIPTTTATVTRAADVASITGTNFSSWYRQDEGTVFADNTSYAINNTRIVSFSDNTTSNRISLSRGAGTGGNVNLLVTTGGAVQVSSLILASSLPASAVLRAAAGFKASDFAGAVNGILPVTQASGSVPSALSQLTIGSGDAPGANAFSGTIRRLTYWPQRLPNSTLQAVTQ